MVAIGGLDPRGASGLVRDFVTIRALGAEPYLVPTAFTVQGASGVERVDLRGADELRQALAAALTPPTSDVASGRPMTVKVGMVGGAALVPVIVEALAGFTGAVVHDPVLAASRGGRLYEGDLTALDGLLARADLVTPNLSEAAALSGVAVTDLESARLAARHLLARGARAVLVKGGHMAGHQATGAADLLVSAGGEEVFSAARVTGKDPRGTGCALASAIAVGLARGASLRVAVAEAKRWVHERIVAAARVGDEHWL